MFARIRLNNIQDYFLPRSGRSGQGVFFCRLAKYNGEIHEGIRKYIEATMVSGACISGKIGNPEEKQLDYYEEMMGNDFQLSPGFFGHAIQKWLPAVNAERRMDIANYFYDIFIEMARSGKNESMQKNAYIKFMCWLYYRFQPMLHQLGGERIPKILAEGYLNDYELKMLSVLSGAGCDVLLLHLQGEEKHLQIDKTDKYAQKIEVEGTSFPPDYSILDMRKSRVAAGEEPELLTFQGEKRISTNTWIQGDPLNDVLMPQGRRGAETSFYYNVFAGVYGAEEASSYYAELLKWKLKAEASDVKIIPLEFPLTQPSFEEIGAIDRKSYTHPKLLLNHLVAQIKCSDKGLQTYCQQAFMSVMAESLELPLQKLLNKAVVIVAWLNRYTKEISKGTATLFLFYGQVQSINEGRLLRIFSRLPVDVLLINPEEQTEKVFSDPMFYLKSFENTVEKQPFPTELSRMQFGTVAYRAEQELNNIIYQDTGIYKNQQFQGAIAVPMQTTYEEINILWGQEAKYRPNFETFDDRVMVPVIFSKVCGVHGSVSEYWSQFNQLRTGDTICIKEFPYITSTSPNPFKAKAYSFLLGGKLESSKIKQHPNYPFAFIREPMQEYMLEKMQELIDSKLIVGTGTTGVENLIVATVLNMDKEILRMIQKYDFTKAIPKVLVAHTKESICTIEDSILIAYLNMIGFDIAIFVPTGYVAVERFYTKSIFVEHQIGEYQYDLRVPEFKLPNNMADSFASKLFRRGR